MVQQIQDDGFKASNITLALGNSDYGSTIRFFTKVIGHAALAIPEFLAEQKYQSPEGVTPGAFHKGHQTDLHPFTWVHSRPDMMGAFLPWMNIQREGRPTFMDVFDVEGHVTKGQGGEETPLFIDVGGASELLTSPVSVMSFLFPAYTPITPTDTSLDRPYVSQVVCYHANWDL